MGSGTKPRLIITGGTGYLGSHILPLLLDKYQVTVIDRTIKRERINDANVTFIESTLMNVTDAMLNDTAILLHAAYSNNLAEEKLFLERASKLNPKLYLVYFSSAAVYGDLPDELEAFTVDSATAPINDYGLYKLVLEYWVQELTKKHLILRIANPYGAEFSCRGVYQIFRKSLLEQIQSGQAKLELKINADKASEMLRDFIRIEELGAKIVTLIKARTRGLSNISSGEGVLLEDFAETVLRELSSELNFDESKYKLSFNYKKDPNYKEIKKSVLR